MWKSNVNKIKKQYLNKYKYEFSNISNSPAPVNNINNEIIVKEEKKDRKIY
jgi:hypothetical protein